MFEHELIETRLPDEERRREIFLDDAVDLAETFAMRAWEGRLGFASNAKAIHALRWMLQVRLKEKNFPAYAFEFAMNCYEQEVNRLFREY